MAIARASGCARQETSCPAWHQESSLPSPAFGGRAQQQVLELHVGEVARRDPHARQTRSAAHHEEPAAWLAIVAFELGRKDAVMVKVSKPNQDLRFDVPVIGPPTIKAMAEAGATCLSVTAGQTLIIGRDEMLTAANKEKIAIVGSASQDRERSDETKTRKSS